MHNFNKYLTEKQIIIGKGAKYGQIVFMAGGAASGKGFAISNFIEGSKFKIRDVDSWKKAFLVLAKTKEKFKEIKGLDLNKPKDALTLHMFIKEKGIKEKTLDLLLSGASEGRLPNIIFDITLKNKNSILSIIPDLFKAGYDSKDIHIVWVLTNYAVAIKQNRSVKRGRVVPEDILMQTHEGAARTMYDFIKKGTPKSIDGGIYIILGGSKNTVFYTDKKGVPIRTGRHKDVLVVKDFTYMTMKLPGSPMTNNAGLQKQAFNWIKQNSPKTLTNKKIFGSGKDKP